MKKTIALILSGLILGGTLVGCQSPDTDPTHTDTSRADVTAEAATDIPNIFETEETQETTTPPAPNPSEMDTSPMENIAYYQNPIMTAETENAWPDYGFGDPFVMRYNGKYYLYVSTKDYNVGIKCWSSLDLVNWTYEGYCTKDSITRGAYAPEVYYYNGYFYMYTSPAGNGHYVLRSTSPTSGFEPVTDNMGMSIDGSVFIDNDGKWYFYTANHGNMMAYAMTSPSKMGNGRTLNTISVNDAWTEGPMVVYHDGYYYMTYTGNHVLSKSYRIYYGASKRSPIAYGNIAAENPLLVNTSDEIFGIGHSSTVKGPDLDSYYIVYHSLVSTVPNRNMNIDRIVFNGEHMEVMGPTVDRQQVPDMPDVYHHFDGGSSLSGWRLTGAFGTSGKGLPLGADSMIVSNYVFEGNYTAEYNVLSISEGAMAGALFSYTDQENFGACLFDPVGQQVIIYITVDGETTTQKVDMIRSFGEDVSFACLQSLQIEKKDKDYTFYMNDRELCVIKDCALESGAIGYMTQNGEASFGFIGGTGAVGGCGVADTYKSVSSLNGLIPADSYTLGSFETVQRDGVSFVSAGEGAILNYRILAAEEGFYDLAVSYDTIGHEAAALLDIYVDQQPVASLTLEASSNTATALCRRIPLGEGQHILSVKLTEGAANFLNFTMLKHSAVSTITENFDKIPESLAYFDGSWKMTEGQLVLNHATPYGKQLYGDKNWGDYTVEVSVTPLGIPNCGLLVRATNPGAPNFMNAFSSDSDARTGTDWLEGYYVGLTAEGVVLYRQSYGSRLLAQAKGDFEAGKTYRLKVVCVGARLQVYVDGTLYIDHTDDTPFLQGMVGVKTAGCAVRFDDLQVAEA